MADLSRKLRTPLEMDWMAVSSYGSGTKTSGVVRILKDLDQDVAGRHVLIVEDIIDSGLTLSWLQANLLGRGAASVKIATALRKPEAAKVDVDVAYVASTFPTSSSSATAWITRKSTVICLSSARCSRTSTTTKNAYL